MRDRLFEKKYSYEWVYWKRKEESQGQNSDGDFFTGKTRIKMIERGKRKLEDIK